MISILFSTIHVWGMIVGGPMLADIGAARLWYAVPLITSASLVYAATRHEEMGPILIHAARFAVWIIVFMALVVAGIQLMNWFF